MKNMKFWRTALVATLVLTVMLSVTGGTIAWFTDSVESGANVITAGNLDVELYHATTGVEEAKVEATTKLFQVPTLWEPGAVAYENLRVANEGDLYLYFDLGINVSGVNTVEGTDNGLDDVLKVAVIKGAVSGDRETILAAAQAAGGKALGCLVEKQSLAPDASQTYGVVIYWEPSANDNNWNLNNGKKTSDDVEYLTINLGVKLEATQFNYEPDSFGPDYDANAKVTVYDEAGLKAAIANGGVVSLRNDIALSSTLEISTGANVTLDLGGNTLSVASGNAIKNNGTLTLTGNGLVKSESSYAVNNSGTVTVNGISTTGMFNSGAMTVENVELKNTISGRHGIYHSGSSLVINGGTFETTSGNELIHGAAANAVINGGSFTQAGKSYLLKNVTVNGGTFYGYVNADGSNDKMRSDVIVKGGTFNFDPTNWVASGYNVTDNSNGTWTVSRNAQNVEATEDKDANTEALTNAINAATAEQPFINLGAGEYKMPSISGNKTVTITGTKDTVIDVTTGAYMDSSTVSFEGVTIKGSTGYVKDANGNQGSDYAALYSPNVTYTNCTFDGPFRIGRNGATFTNCTFNLLDSNGEAGYVWTNGSDCTFVNCTFESGGKALLIYADGNTNGDMNTVTVENCVFNATQGAKAGAIANQNCAAIEIHNWGTSVNLTTSGNTIDSDFSGEWRIKTYENNGKTVTVNGVAYTTIAIDGKQMTKDASNNVTVID